MKEIIIEDEQIAAQNLTRLLAETEPDVEVTAKFQTVEETVEFFSAFGSQGRAADGYPDIVFTPCRRCRTVPRRGL